jgi:hypothetical protein
VRTCKWGILEPRLRHVCAADQTSTEDASCMPLQMQRVRAWAAALTLTVHRKNWEPAEADVMFLRTAQGTQWGTSPAQTITSGYGLYCGAQIPAYKDCRRGFSHHFSDTVHAILTALQLHIRGLKGEALLTVCVGASIGHAEDARASVLQLEVLVLELGACASTRQQVSGSTLLLKDNYAIEVCCFSNMQVVPVISAQCHSGKGSRTIDALSSSAVSSGEVTTCKFMIHFLVDVSATTL